MSKQPCFRNTEDRLEEIPAKGDPLELLAAAVDSERIRPKLEKASGAPNPTCV